MIELEPPCLYVRSETGVRILPVFATFNTRWNRETSTLEVGERRFRAGDRVLLGGAPMNPIPANVTWVQAPDARCSTAEVFATYSVAGESGP